MLFTRDKQASYKSQNLKKKKNLHSLHRGVPL